MRPASLVGLLYLFDFGGFDVAESMRNCETDHCTCLDFTGTVENLCAMKQVPLRIGDDPSEALMGVKGLDTSLYDAVG
jgi:hypothetical protein